MADVHSTLGRIPLFAGRSLSGLIVQPLASLTNRTYKIALDGERYVLRIAGRGTERFIDRTAELRNATLASSIGVAPDLLFFDAADGTMLTRYIAGTTLDAARMREPATLQLAARTLHRLHASGVAFAGRMVLFPKLDEYLALMAARGQDDRGLLAARARIERLRPAFEDGATALVPCHIDPTPPNFLLALQPAGPPAMYLLDWEYAAMGEAAWDLAGLSIEAEFGETEDRLLLAAYFGDPPPAAVARFRLHQALLRLVAGSWAVAHAGESEADELLLAMADRRIAEFEAQMRSLAASGIITG
jgi:thiamine kinase-like enzyme